jgi:membrane bound O-acyltransferase family protein
VTQLTPPPATREKVVRTPLPAWRGWLPIVVLPVAVLLAAPPDWPPWALMWTLAVAIYAGCKWLTWRRTPAPSHPAAPAWKHLGYLLAWPGLDAPAFLGRSREPVKRPAAGEWAFALAKAACGIAILYGLTRLVPPDHPYLAGWVGMVGLIFVLHFGAFHLLSCAWRRIGVVARPLMDWPVAAASVSDFWGRRWNTAFRDLTHRFLFRPLAARLGPRAAVAAGFLFSGVVHDLVISIPAGGGFGGPTLFFAIQAAAMLAERSRAGRRLGLGSGWRGRLFTALVLVVPAPLLFHPPFVERVVVPFLGTIGAV